MKRTASIAVLAMLGGVSVLGPVIGPAGVASAAAKPAAAKPAAAKPAVAPTTAAPSLPPGGIALAPTATLVQQVNPDGVPTMTYVAAAKQRLTNIYGAKNDVKPQVVFDNRKNFSGRHVFLVVQRDGDWLKVKVPMRPNERTGWIRLADVNLYHHDYAIVVSLSQFNLVVYKGGKEVQREKIAIGQNQWPTPTGSFFIRELAKPANPRGAYGPYAFGLSAYSNVLTKFGRGDGQVGIHGTNAPGALGGKASHGCIRVGNAGITKMAQTLPQGVPVEVRA